MVQAAVDRLGIPWALRIVGFICLVVGFIAVCCVRRRDSSKKLVQYKMFDASLFKIPGYPLYLAFAFLQLFGYVVVIFFIPSEPLVKFSFSKFELII